MEDKAISEVSERLLQVLGKVVSHVCNETIILAQFEGFQAEAFPQLWIEQDDVAFSARMERVSQHLGGPLGAYVVRDGHEVPPVDNYPVEALHETIEVFLRARTSVLRATMFDAGSRLLMANPELIELSADPTVSQAFMHQAQATFWEHAESAYIRLYSFWDRVGQVLDFAFFNIRKFDQNGFNAVMDRIHANAVPIDVNLKVSGSWKRLRAFQCSEKDDGLKWLLQRRNLVVHSLHLHPLPDIQDDVFKSQFNHLEVAHREKLRPRSQLEEVALLKGQLGKAAELFSCFLTVVEHSPLRQQERFIG